MGKLDGRVVLVSGAARGQGEAEARLFVAEGAKVVIGDVLDDAGSALADSLGKDTRFVHLDVREEDFWAAAVELAIASFGKLDGLINNAGILRWVPIADSSLADYLDVVNVNQVGTFLGMRAVIPAIKAAGGGTIVNTSSTNGLIGMEGTAAYTASKFAIRGMTKVAALELGRFGIRVNSIHPGGVRTPMIVPEGIKPKALEAMERNGFGKLPLGRMARPEEIARMALFLSCDDSSYCTGGEFVIDGGMMAGPAL